MIQAIRQRLDRDEEGFTLIELMVVVLIIAILLAIAIPTFLGARGKAQSRATQSNLRNAFTAEKTLFTDAQSYSAGTAGVTAPLLAVEPSINWLVSGTAATVATGVVLTGTQVDAVGSNILGATGINDNVILLALDPAGNCWYINDETIAPAAGAFPSVGTSYATNKVAATKCTPPAYAAVTTGAATGAAAGWYTAW